MGLSPSCRPHSRRHRGPAGCRICLKDLLFQNKVYRNPFHQEEYGEESGWEEDEDEDEEGGADYEVEEGEKGETAEWGEGGDYGGGKVKWSKKGGKWVKKKRKKKKGKTKKNKSKSGKNRLWGLEDR